VVLLLLEGEIIAALSFVLQATKVVALTPLTATLQRDKALIATAR